MSSGSLFPSLMMRPMVGSNRLSATLKPCINNFFLSFLTDGKRIQAAGWVITTLVILYLHNYGAIVFAITISLFITSFSDLGLRDFLLSKTALIRNVSVAKQAHTVKTCAV